RVVLVNHTLRRNVPSRLRYTRSPLLYSFFFYCYHHHPDLHSFPTRRSSDLARVFHHPLWRDHCALSRNAFGAAHVRACCRCYPRSEEHTSELQSQSNLVCRLLLEKKKNSSHTGISHGKRTEATPAVPSSDDL